MGSGRAQGAGRRGDGSRPTVLGLFDWTPPTDGSARLRDPETPLPYRADLLPSVSGLGLEVLSPARGRVHRKLRDVVEHRSGVAVDLALRGLPRARTAAAVLAFLEPQLAALAWLRRRRASPYARIPAVGISCWWAEELVAGTRDPRQVREVVAGLDRLFVLSSNQHEIFERAGVPGEKVVPVLFGADHRHFTPVSAAERYDVLAVGVDRGRDWETLLEAARRIPHRRVDIITGTGRIPADEVPANVTVHPPTGFAAYRAALQAARLVVVPSLDLAYPTGQSVMLEAMACGRCVVVTATRAMAEYIGDGTAVLSTPPGDPGALAVVIDEMLSDDAGRAAVGLMAREAVERRFTFEGMWTRIGEELTALL
ncbi:glycosyltransferase family 4 protein [Brachybacterium saurashtrense]|uniref:Glycosyltransferase family 1 protein n=1 Tax=Brachybacterium saurashtrense TaxID=556288 RepID=A0A345YSG3_9MICO|nr:glycosyltransferase family 4 protein [Brachybacterium saurashtrense]AXK46865.1 glycosyltransferase family 1 protein [Brachybacterium saurashtrense]RRR22580.1 glycosyltransferase family 1 protein [Brachybacterium saurashtrense]